MLRSIAPNKLWNFCLTYVTYTHSLTDHLIYNLGGGTPYEISTRDTPDISECFEYEWCAPVWYLEPGYFPVDGLKSVRWLVVAHHVGQLMFYYILPESGVKKISHIGSTILW